MVKKKKDIAILSTPCYPIMGLPISVRGYKPMLRRRAKFAPQMIADGLSEGVSQEQGNLLKQFFDQPDNNQVDDFCNIHSDKFSMMQNDINTSVDPVEPDENV